MDISSDLTLKWAEAAGTLSGVVREQARRAHDKARERYEGMTKAELSDLLDERDLPKTGTGIIATSCPLQPETLTY